MLTQSQQKTFKFICEYIRSRGISPSLAEIAQGLGIKSRGVTHRYVQALAEEGYIKLTPGRHRNIQLIKNSTEEKYELPFEGRIAAGRPIEALPDKQTIELNKELFSNDRYALEVKGDSMIDAGILDGDIVLIKHQNTANNGDIVVALIDNEEVTLKRYLNLGNNVIRLIPENSEMNEMIYSADRIKIQGVLAAQYRKYN